MNRAMLKRLVMVEDQLPPPPVVFLLPDEWKAMVNRHGGNESRASRALGSEPVLVPDEQTRNAAEEMFNDPLNSFLKITYAPVWDRIVECNNGCPVALQSVPMVVAADKDTYIALAGKRPEIREFGIGLTEEETRVLEERKKAGSDRNQSV